MNGSGGVLGGAIGLENTYLDLIIFDGEDSLSAIKKVLQELKFSSGTCVHFFVSGNEGRRIVL